GKGADVEPLADRQGPGGDQLAGRRADDGGAQNAPAAVGYDLDMADDFALGLGPVVLVIGPAQHLDGNAAPTRLRLREADMGEFRVGEGHARDHVVVRLHPQAEQRVPQHQASVVVGEVGELPAPGGVADGVDAAVAGLQGAVHDDAGAVALDAGAFEVEI